MSEVEPTVVRVLDVPPDVLLPELHDLQREHPPAAAFA